MIYRKHGFAPRRGAHPPRCGLLPGRGSAALAENRTHRNGSSVHTNPARALPGEHTRLGCGFSRPRGKRGRTVTDQASIAAPHAPRRDARRTRDARHARVPRTFFHSCSYVVKQLVAAQYNRTPEKACVSGLRDFNGRPFLLERRKGVKISRQRDGRNCVISGLSRQGLVENNPAIHGWELPPRSAGL